jgi:hypothetical protein
MRMPPPTLFLPGSQVAPDQMCKSNKYSNVPEPTLMISYDSRQ